MKIYSILILAFTLFHQSLPANPIYRKPEEAQLIKPRKLVLIVISTSGLDDAAKKKTEDLNARFVDIVKNDWTFTKGDIKVISTDESRSFFQSNNPNQYVALEYSLYTIGGYSITGKFSSHDKMKAWIQLYLGENYERLKAVKDERVLEMVTVKQVQVHEPFPDAVTIHQIVRDMQNVLVDANADPKSIKKAVEYYDLDQIVKYNHLAKSKTLLIPKELLEEDITDEDVKNNYPYKFEIVPYVEIIKAIRNKDATKLYVNQTPHDLHQNITGTTGGQMNIKLHECANGRLLGRYNITVLEFSVKQPFHVSALKGIVESMSAASKSKK